MPRLTHRCLGFRVQTLVGISTDLSSTSSDTYIPCPLSGGKHFVFRHRHQQSAAGVALQYGSCRAFDRLDRKASCGPELVCPSSRSSLCECGSSSFAVARARFPRQLASPRSRCLSCRRPSRTGNSSRCWP
jgi:hypothetical protein